MESFGRIGTVWKGLEKTCDNFLTDDEERLAHISKIIPLSSFSYYDFVKEKRYYILVSDPLTNI